MRSFDNHPLQGIKQIKSAVGILNQFKATNDRFIQNAILSENSYLLFDLYKMIPTYFQDDSNVLILLVAMASEVILE